LNHASSHASGGSDPADSVGQPWAGRDLPPAPYAGDDGRPDPALTAALARLGSGPDVETEVVRALGSARVFVAVVALPDGSPDSGPDASTDAGTDMGLVWLDRPDGRRALPVFTSPQSLGAWRGDGRPVPADGRRVALSAVAEGGEILHLDPGGPVEYVVRRPAVWALAQGWDWRPSYANPVVTQTISRLCAELGLAADCEPGEAAELRIVLSLSPGLDATSLDQLTTALSRRLGQSEVVAEQVDSLEISLRSA
jgi:hypothetical protein